MAADRTSRADPPVDDTVAGGRGDVRDYLADEPEPEPRLHFGWGKHLPMIRQSESSECALACLAMIAGYYGHHVDLPTLRQRFSSSLKGTTLKRLMDMAQSLGLVCRPLRLNLDELARLQTPCILHWDLDHFVVLRTVRKHCAIVHDPAAGERRLRFDEISPHWTGVAVEISKGPTFKRKAPPPPVSLRALAGSIEGLPKALAVIFSLALLLELIALLWPQFLQTTIDQVLADGDQNLLTFLGLSFLLLLVMRTVVSALRTWTIMWLSTHFNLSWTGNVFQHLLRLPQDYFLKRHMGDIVSRFRAVSVIQQTVSTRFVTVIIDGLMATLTLVVMLIYSSTLTGMVVLAVAIYAIIRALYYRVYFAANLSQITVRAKQQSVFMEAVRGVETLRLHNRGPAHAARYLNAAADTQNTSIKVKKLNLLFGSVNGLTTGAQRIGVLWLGASLALGGHFSAGMLMAYVAYADQFTSRACSLVEYLVQLKLLRLQGERLADIVMTPPEQHADGNRGGALPESSIRFEHVSFRYAPSEPWVIQDASFEVKAGQSVVITGPSGGGKTTLVRLMLGLLDPQQGDIFIGGVNLKQLGKHAWRSMAGAVMQDDTLFTGSIADNISFHDEAATPEKIETAARQAQIHDDIVAMPLAYHTLLGDMGSALSGGQKQRVFLARALYKQPEVLVLDEATSHVDVACERKINAMCKELHSTRVVVAHRPETMHAADHVLICIKGLVREVSLKAGGSVPTPNATAPSTSEAPSRASTEAAHPERA